jgi:hypothetical protein
MRSNILAGIRQRVERLAGAAWARDETDQAARRVAILEDGRRRAREAPPPPPYGSPAYEQDLAAAVQWARDLRAKMRAAGYPVAWPNTHPLRGPER